MNKAIFILKRQSSLFHSSALRWRRLENHFPNSISTYADRPTSAHWRPTENYGLPLGFLQGSRRYSTAHDDSTRQARASTPSPPQTRRLTNHLITIGICSAVVAAVLVSYPLGWPENLQFGTKKSAKSSETLPGNGIESNKRDVEETTLFNNKAVGAKEDDVLKAEEVVPGSKEVEEHLEQSGDEALQDKSYYESRPMEGDMLSKGLINDEGIPGPVHVDEHQQWSGNEAFKENSDGGLVPMEHEQLAQSDKPVPPEIDAHIHVELPTSLSNGSERKEAQVTVEVNNGDVSESETYSISVDKEDGVSSKESFNEILAAESLQKVFSSDQVLDAHSGRPSLSEAYFLLEGHEDNIRRLQKRHEEETKMDSGSDQQESSSVLKVRKEDAGEGTSIKKLEKAGDAFDFLEVLHAAEQRQAEADARLYQENRRNLEEKYQQELKDAQAKELMYAEEANYLAKELAKEKARAVAALKLEQEKAEERLNREIKRKEEEANLKLYKSELLGKTYTAAAVAQEKGAHLKNMREAKLQIDALHMAFYTQSEEARQSHTVHKLAVGTFAMEDAMMRGAPVEKEVALILSSTGGYGSDPLLDAAILSLSQEAVKEGTRTPAQLHQKFENLTGALRELSLIPAAGGGLLSHAAARVVSALKVREQGDYSDGIEAVISKVQRYLGDGNLADAADLLERGVQGTKAEDIVAEWVRHARNRAAMEQALSLLQAHATTIAASLA